MQKDFVMPAFQKVVYDHCVHTNAFILQPVGSFINETVPFFDEFKNAITDRLHLWQTAYFFQKSDDLRKTFFISTEEIFINWQMCCDQISSYKKYQTKNLLILHFTNCKKTIELFFFPGCYLMNTQQRKRFAQSIIPHILKDCVH